VPGTYGGATTCSSILAFAAPKEVTAVKKHRPKTIPVREKIFIVMQGLDVWNSNENCRQFAGAQVKIAICLKPPTSDIFSLCQSIEKTATRFPTNPLKLIPPKPNSGTYSLNHF
jgi:hypothetical protein